MFFSFIAQNKGTYAEEEMEIYSIKRIGLHKKSPYPHEDTGRHGFYTQPSGTAEAVSLVPKFLAPRRSAMWSLEKVVRDAKVLR